ncbi:ADP-glyceromanno-heptose 6-epimerase [Limisalsivibrio acetivorans]|uniref:ADP-glyceromanno-heptose 6-epimerase n=1 Tax=Limisalsivibrio acetivorans TaxID=1304888 RepID=UPI0003B45CCD|nr:ADP-glyceromanno-heptose 6-epimerase [Limisalsivibrio acetivorans]
MYIVTGGAGFIGSNIVKGLNDRGIDDILIVDNLSNSQKHLNLNRLKYRDYVDKKDFFEFLGYIEEDIDVIFHQGACSNTMETDGRYMMENNYEFSRELLLFALEKKIRFIYASSASIYGNGDDGFVEAEECEYPLNIYAFSKFSFDNYIRGLGKLNSQVVGLRYFNVYGPQENHKGSMASVAYHFFNQMKEDNKVKLFEGSKDFRRDFIHVQDVVDVNMFFFENPKLSGIFNCGTGKARSFFDIAEAMKESYPDVEVEFVPFPEKLKGKYQAYTQADLSKLREIGYEGDFRTLEEGVGEYLMVLENTGGYIK